MRKSLPQSARLAVFLMCLATGMRGVGDAAENTSPPPVDEAVAQLRKLASPELGAWKFHVGDEPDAAAADFDDSDWKTATPEHNWGEQQICWYRIRIRIPERIGRVILTGKPVRLKVAVDDDGELFLDGKPAGRFHWDEGELILTEVAQPGQEFVVALKAINTGGPGRLLSASIHYDALTPFAEIASRLAGELEFCEELIEAADEEKRSLLREALEDACSNVLAEALRKGSADALGQAEPRIHHALSALVSEASGYELHLIGHAHIDMNWLWLWPETKQVCHDTFTQALKFMKEWPEFKFSQSQCSTYQIMETDWPEVFEDIRMRVRTGQWDVTAARWVEGDTNMADGEAICRQLLYAYRYCSERLGTWSSVCWEPDTFGHAWTMPQFLQKAGIKYYYHMRCGPSLPLHYWESPDGSRVLVCKTDTYNGKVRDDSPTVPLHFKKTCGVPVGAIIYGVGDHGGGPTRRDVETALRLRKRKIVPRIRFSSAEAFFDSVAQRDPDLPVIRDELNTVFEGCYTSHADIKLANRRCEYELPAAETLSLMAHLHGAGYPARSFEDAWRITCFNQFHDILCGCAIHGSYEYSIPLAQRARDTAALALRSAANCIGGRADTRGGGEAVVVVNPLGWSRSAIVELGVPSGLPAQCRAVNVLGQPGPAQVVDRADGAPAKVIFSASNLPPAGYEVYHLEGGRCPTTDLKATSDGRMENEFLKLRVNPQTGCISSLKLKSSGREFVPSGGEAAVLQLLHEAGRGMSAWIIGRITETRSLTQPVSSRLLYAGPLQCAWRSEYEFGRSRFRQDFVLSAGVPRLDVRFRADWQEVGTEKDGAWMLKVAFPTRLDEPAAAFEIPFGHIERPASGAEVPAQKWIDLTQYAPAARTEVNWTTLELNGLFDARSFSRQGHGAEADFDGHGWSFPAEMLPAQPTARLNGVVLRLPRPGSGRPDSVCCNGQNVKTPEGEYAALAILGAGACGDRAGSLTLNYADCRHTEHITLEDWCLGVPTNCTAHIDCDHRHSAEGDTTPACHLWVKLVRLDPRRVLRGFVLPVERNMRIMAASLGDGFPTQRRGSPVAGISLLNDCKYGHDVRGATMRLSLLRTSYSPDPKPDVGVHNVVYSLYPHEGGWVEADTVRHAYELNQPVVAQPEPAHGGPGGIRGSMIRLQPSNLIVSALKRAEDNEDVILRFYESAGRRTLAYLAFRFPVREVVETDLLERPVGDPLFLNPVSVALEVEPYEIVTLRLRRP